MGSMGVPLPDLPTQQEGACKETAHCRLACGAIQQEGRRVSRVRRILGHGILRPWQAF